MNTDDFRAFTARLVEELERRPEVLGLVLLGSTAERERLPDAWSDHDFFVIVEPAHAERYRGTLDWVPDAVRLVLVHRETEHGLKMLYDDGHLLECAVFTPEETKWARGDVWRVPFSRGLDLEAILARNAASSEPSSADAWLARQALSELLVGAGRFRRGERLAGHRMVFGYAMPRLVELFARHAPRTGEGVPDPLDPLRRFEAMRPELGHALDELLTRPADEAAIALVRLAARHLQGTPAALPDGAVAAVLSSLR